MLKMIGALVALAFGAASAQADLAPPPQDSPAIWRVTGGAADVYLFGSIHLLPPDVRWRTPELEAAMEKAQIVVLEADVDADPGAMQGLVARLGLLPQGETLRAIIPEAVRTDLERTLAAMQMPPQAMDPMRPWLASVTLSVQFFAQQGYDPARGVDRLVGDWAKANGRTLAYLETAEEQLDIFARLSREEEVQLLAVTLEQIRDTPDLADKMLAAWRSGDLAGLEEVMNAGFDKTPALRDALLRARHERWLPQIRTMMESGRPHLVVVGAAHLAGPDSVVAMLRAQGIAVEGP